MHGLLRWVTWLPKKDPVLVEHIRDIPRSFALRRFAGPHRFCQRWDSPIRVAHITDQHVGRVTPHTAQLDAVTLANLTEADVVALTGDFVAHSQLYLDQLIEVLSGLDAPAFAVLGNHDHWAGADEVRWALQQAGVELLDNAHTTITVRGERLQVLGLDDAYTGHADVDKALKGLDQRIPTLGLSHIAEEADRLWPGGVDLVLSGHTHAGQLTVARLHELAVGRLAGHRYVHGLYGDRGAGAVYVGAGVGASVFPFRLGDRGKREVAVFDLGLAPGSIDEHHDEQPPGKGRAPSDKKKQKRRAQVAKKAKKRSKRFRS